MIINKYLDNKTKFIHNTNIDKYYIRTYKNGFYLLFSISKSQRHKYLKYNILPQSVNVKNLILNSDILRIKKHNNKRLLTNLKINNHSIQTTTNRFKEAYNKANDLGIETININNILILNGIRLVNEVLKSY